MAGLQVLEETFQADGFHLLGFFSNDFGQQGGTDEEIGACNAEHGVTFEQFSMDHVIDPDGAGPEVAQPVFAWLQSQPDPGPASPLKPTWNFHKYLVSRDGVLLAHWATSTYPGDDPNDPSDSFDTNPIVVAIRAALSAP
jgi:glutathione peroxidase